MSSIFHKIYDNHVMANLLFALVIAMGLITFISMPREQDPSVNFNWIQVTTIYPGAAATDVEKLVTKPIEDAIQNLADIKFVSSSSRENVSSILVRFEDLKSATFDKRINDLRREIQSKEGELPENIISPVVLEITTANAFPTALLAIVGKADDERLRKASLLFKEDLERMPGIDRVEAYGLHDPELQIAFDPQELVSHQLNPLAIADTVKAYFQDLSAGTIKIGSDQWLIRWLGQKDLPEYVAALPILNSNPELKVGDVASISRARAKPDRIISYSDKHAVMLSIMKQENTNTLTLVDRIKHYIEDKNTLSESTGIELALIDDQTQVTKNALNVMQNNAIVGLFLVLLTTWIFLGFSIAFVVSIGIPFILAATIWFIDGLGFTLNISVLLGIVISLGMLVDDSVVAVEAIYIRLANGMDKTKAISGGIKEIFTPVVTSVLTTISAFLPLMLLPGILGKFMMVIPLVVIVALLISLLEAFWMLPSHIKAMQIDFSKQDKLFKYRKKITHWTKITYVRYLIKVIRKPKHAIASLVILFTLAITAIISGLIKFNFFANDPLRIFYINIEMPAGSSLENTMQISKYIEAKIKSHLSIAETRSTVSYAGLAFTETEPSFGDQYGQIAVSLKPQTKKLRNVDQVIADMRDDVMNTAGPVNISFLRLSGGPPTSKPVKVKVRGNDYSEIQQAAEEIKQYLETVANVFDIESDYTKGRVELKMYPNTDAIHRIGLNPSDVARIIRQFVDGEVITDYLSNGEKVEVRLQADNNLFAGKNQFLNQTIAIKNRQIRLAELVTVETAPGVSNVRHYNFRRAITIAADIDKNNMNTLAVNNLIKKHWETLSKEYPNIDLNFTGELDDIEESLNAMPKLFLFGIGLMYLILGTQFKSYWQPIMIIFTIPLAFVGVIFGLCISQNPISLYTLYGIIALSGITVNASIVLISAANQRLQSGMSLSVATIYAARRRLIPILITSLTTIAGLFSLATGLGGKSLLWGPVATSIVWGLMFSTILTLFFIPLIYSLTMRKNNV